MQRFTLGLTGLLCLFLLGFSYEASAQFSVQFQDFIGSSIDQRSYSIQQLPDSGYVVAGYTNTTTGTIDVYVVRLSQFGGLIWANRYDIGGNDYGYYIDIASDGGFAITGKTQNLDNCCSRNDIFILKIRSDGTFQWVKTYGGSLQEEALCIQRTSDNGYIVAGKTESFGAGSFDGLLLKTDINGTLQWMYTYGDTLSDHFTSVHQTTDGGYIAAGETSSYGNGRQAYAVRTNSSGVQSWTRSYGGSALESIWSVRQTSDGGYITVGVQTSYTATPDLLLVKLTAGGTILWSRTYGINSSWDEALSVKETSDRGLIIGGYVQGHTLTNSLDAYLLRTDGTGNRIWSMAYGGTGIEYGWDVIQTMDGNYAFAGLSTSFFYGLEDVYVVATDGQGNTPCLDTLVNEVADSLSITANTDPSKTSRVRVECSDSAVVVPYGDCDIRCSAWQWGGHGIKQAEPTDAQSDRSAPPASLEKTSTLYPEFINRSFSVYPNPVDAGSPLIIKYSVVDKLSADISVTDLLGRVVFQGTYSNLIGSSELIIPTSSWTPGMYLITIKTGTDAQVFTVALKDK